jgi:hypothetical protein
MPRGVYDHKKAYADRKAEERKRPQRMLIDEIMELTAPKPPRPDPTFRVRLASGFVLRGR